MVGAPSNPNAANAPAGRVRVYALANGTWQQVGNDINGQAPGDAFGSSVALADERLAAGAPLNDDGGADAGSARVFSVPSNAVPVTLRSFAASAKTRDVELAWVTATELDASHFAVEHARDGSTWREIGTVDTRGRGGLGAAYDFTHVDAGPGAHYYRLAAVDYDGATEHSTTVTAALGSAAAAAAELSTFPNPTSTGRIRVTGAHLDGARLTVTDAAGRVLLERRGDATGVLELDLGHLAAGVYYVVAKHGFGVSRTAVTVE